MASSSGNSSGLQNSGSDEDLQVLMDQRKRKRMQSNRESARRSRMRKQKHLDELTAQVAHLRSENSRLLTTITITTQHFLNVEADNSVLRAQAAELSQRLQSLNDILDYMNSSSSPAANAGVFGGAEDLHLQCFPDMNMNSSWNLMYLNQPIMASADMFQY